MKKRKTVLIFMGPPGSGKGTQTDKLSEKLKLPIVSPGELLRQEVKKKTAVGRKVEKRLARGEFIDNKVVEKLLARRLAGKDAQDGVIFDGFPRNVGQLDFLEKLFANFDKKQYNIWAVYINISDQEAKKRLTARRDCFCGATYHLMYMPPKKKGICDLCGRKIGHRPDDRPAVVIRRLKLARELNKPLLKYFTKKKILLKINGEQAILKIQKDILAILKKKGI